MSKYVTSGAGVGVIVEKKRLLGFVTMTRVCSHTWNPPRHIRFCARSSLRRGKDLEELREGFNVVSSRTNATVIGLTLAADLHDGDLLIMLTATHEVFVDATDQFQCQVASRVSIRKA